MRAIAYDGRGNTASETRPASATVTTGYDGHGRLISYVRTGDASQTNVYNGLDDRVTVTSGSTTRRYLYDADGRLLGEYGASASASNVVAETIWLSPEVAGSAQPFGGDDGVMGYAPLAVSVGSTGTLNYVHGSHLGVPLVTTNTSGTVIAPGTQMQPGFPGQLRTFADLYYNRYRDYDSSIGRYIQADPIGLSGGVNPYVYALNNPLRFTDPSGKCPWCVAVVVGAAIGALFSYDWQVVVEHRNPDCIDWRAVGTSAIIGGLTGGVGELAMPLLSRMVGGGIGKIFGRGAGAGEGGGAAGGVGGAGSGGAGAGGGAAGGAANSAGIIAQDGTSITGLTKHGVDRVIGDGAKRAGTRPDAILDAVKNPTKIKEGVDSLGRPFKIYTGKTRESW